MIKRVFISNKIINNASWLVLEKISRMAVSLIVGVWVARYLGAERFGALNYAQSFVGLMAAIANLGLDNIVIRNLVQSPKDSYVYLGTAFYLKLVGGLLSILFSILSIMIVEPNDSNIVILCAIISTGNIFVCFSTIDLWFQSQLNSKFSVYAQSVSFFITSIIKLFFILNEASLIMFAFLSALEMLLLSIGYLIVYKLKVGILKEWKFSIIIAKSLMKDSWPLILSGLAIMLYMRIDQIMIGIMNGNQEVGIYSVAVKLGELWYFVPVAIVSSIYPIIVKEKDNNLELFYKRLQKLYDFMALLGYIIAITISVLSPYIITLLYGDEFIHAAPILSIYIWIGLFVNMGLARTAYLNSFNWGKIHFISSLSGCIINILLNLILIPKYGGVGAAFASLFSYWFQAHGINFFFSKISISTKMQTKSLLIIIRIKDLLNILKWEK
ncbi:flippase [Neobacillus sp. NRS-1170]|uniref:flippase n=1 Tax=Neobacillus sp. NRS-1170 TaxID=3233898 RepID=UPI003D2B24A1